MADKVKPPAPPSPQRIRLDWRAYFYEFCRLHLEPVVWEGRLLFRDGWQYSAVDYSGPEYPPPTDHVELDGLVVRYWVARLRVLIKTHRDLIAKRDHLRSLQQVHSLPLQRVEDIEGADGKRVRGTVPLDLRALDERIAWVAEDINECETRLREIEEFHRSPPVRSA